MDRLSHVSQKKGRVNYNYWSMFLLVDIKASIYKQQTMLTSISFFCLILQLPFSFEFDSAFTVSKLTVSCASMHHLTRWNSIFVRTSNVRRKKTALQEFSPKHPYIPPPSTVRGNFNGKAYSIEWDVPEARAPDKAQISRISEEPVEEFCGSHDGSHGDHHNHAHHSEANQILDQNRKASETIELKSRVSKSEELRSRHIIFSMIRSTWAKDGLAQVVLCTVLMIVTKLVKVCVVNN